MKYAQLRAQLAKLAGNPLEIAKAIPTAMRASPTLHQLAVRAVGATSTITKEQRDQLLQDAAAGKYVEIEVDILAFEQQPGVRNRASVRFRDGAMMALGRSGVGTPFLRDHEQWDVRAVGGTIISSATDKRGDGDYVIRQTAKLTAPWAVDLVLRDLVHGVSIGWRPLGPVMCSVCDAEIFTQCWHFPGDELSEPEAKALKVAPTTIVEWIYTDAELKETSGVPIGAVPNARIDGSRASLATYLSEQHPSLRPMLGHGENFLARDFPLEEKSNVDLAQLIALLGLAATATPGEVLSAVDKLKGTANTAEADRAELAIKKTELEKHASSIAALQADKKKRDEDKFIVEALATGRIATGDEKHWRALYDVDAVRATKLMEERPAQASTPVGAERASDKDPDRAPVITGGTNRMSRVKRSLAVLTEQLAANPMAADYAVNAFGFSDPLGRLRVPTTLAATTIGNQSQLTSAQTGFHAAFLEQFDATDDIKAIAQLFTEVPSSRKAEEWDWMGDAPDMEEWTADRKLSGLDTFQLTVKNKKWSSGLRIKNDDFKDDNLGLIPPQIAQMALRARMHRFNLMVKMLQNGFDGTTYPEAGNGLAYDGAFFFSDSHKGGNDNKMTVVLNSANLAQAEQQLRQMRTYDGAYPYGARGTALVVGPQNEATAEKLMTSDYLGTAVSTETNYQKGKYKIVVADQIDLVHPLDWFLVDLSSPIKPLLFQMREEVSTSAIMGGQGTNNDSLPRFSRDELWFGAEARYNASYFEFRRAVGSRSA